MLQKYIEKILRARVYDVAQESPLDYAPSLSARLGNTVYLKREDLQSVFSFKLRGAYNKMASLTPEQLQRGVVTASAGNHAQGVALSAQKMGVTAVIVMPKTTPEIKVNSVRAKGANILLHGDSYDDALAHALALAESEQRVFIHPYDDAEVIAGQGTIGMEILRQQRTLDAVFVPVGGGGLIAGVAAYIKFVRPEIKIIAVEPEDSDCLHRALQAKRRVMLKQVGLFADGVAVKQIGKEPFHIAQQCVDAVITVSTDEICAAIKDVFDDTRSVMEPAGALAVAGLKKYVMTHALTQQALVAITSGANMNFDRLRYVAERAQVGEQREILLAVTIPEAPGSFMAFCQLLGRRSVTEFNYRYYHPTQAQVFVGVSTSGLEADRLELIQLFAQQGFAVTDMTANELAKEHIRYMVGGHAPKGVQEVVYSLSFPERPGALLNFLLELGDRWNISLFHYRNHGAAFGQVLLGVQLPKQQKKLFQECLERQAVKFKEATHNPAYQLFAGLHQR